MLDVFYEGGPLFMGILTIILIAMVCTSVVNGLPVLTNRSEDAEVSRRRIGYVRSIGLFALIIGLLGQLIGLFSAFRAIELYAVNVSPSLVAGGFKVSMITTIYGLLIYALSFVIWFGLSMVLKRN